ncbi:GAF domain-containing protein [Nocardia sp. NPDC005366]|uniref:GAF domain-containing protein n=1 Tax=Nocardia sp. NPDC005366 TaxID=3156878 RepID=UPI0033B0774A
MAHFELVTERIRSALRLGGGDLSAVCDTCVQVIPVRRAAILINEPHLGVQPWAASDEWTTRIEAAQATAGEGPAFDAVATGMPVTVADLGTGCDGWPAFAALLRRESASGALVAVPLCSGAIRLGTLDLYLDAPGTWSSSTLAEAQHIANLIAAHLVSANTAPPPTSTLIHHAAATVIAQRQGSTADAYARLRAEGLRRGMFLAELAEQVVDHRIRLTADDVR